MKILYHTFLLLFSINCTAQNFNCFQDTAKNYFVNNEGYVRGIRIDSIRTTGSDTIYYPYRTRRISRDLSLPQLYTKIDTLGASWLGKKVIKQADGTFLFDNMWDTVIIKTEAHTGDSWIFFNDTTRYSYTATVTSESTLSVLGTLDSVKTITITADSAGVALSSDPVNNFEIILSKNHGFVNVFDLYTFPYHRPDSLYCETCSFQYTRWFDYYLDVVLNNLGTCDITDWCFDNKPDTNNSIFHIFSFHNPTMMEIYDFAAGDVFESEFYTYLLRSYTVDSITSRTATPYNIVYGGPAHKMIWTYLSMADPPIVTYAASTLSVVSADTNLLILPSRMPEEWNAGYLLHYFPHLPISPGCDSPASYVVDWDYRGTGFNSDGFSLQPSFDRHTYSIGYGMSEYHYYNSLSYREEEQNYVYYLKNGTDCGSYVRVLPTGVNDPENARMIRISPNPADDYLTIKSPLQFDENTTISVLDITGRSIYNTNAANKTTITINTFAWNSGIYMVVIQNPNGVIKREKVVVLK